MSVIDTEHAMRNMVRRAKQTRFEPGTANATSSLNATNVQDAINEIAAVAGSGGAGPYLLQAGNQVTTGGFEFTAVSLGPISSGTILPNALTGNYQFLTNNGPFTIAAPAADCAVDLLVVNGSTAGAITFTGFTVGNTGDSLNTTNGNRFLISIRVISGVATYLVKALQ